MRTLTWILLVTGVLAIMVSIKVASSPGQLDWRLRHEFNKCQHATLSLDGCEQIGVLFHEMEQREAVAQEAKRLRLLEKLGE